VIFGVVAADHTLPWGRRRCVLVLEPFVALAGPPHARSRLPSPSNSITGVPPRSISRAARESAAPFSSSISVFGRWISHTWSRASTAIPAT